MQMQGYWKKNVLLAVRAVQHFTLYPDYYAVLCTFLGYKKCNIIRIKLLCCVF